MHSVIQSATVVSREILGGVPPELQDGHQRNGAQRLAIAGRVGGQKESLAEAHARFLEPVPWEIFGHVSFGGWSPTEDYARRELIRHFLWPVNVELYGKRWKKRDQGIMVASAFEYGKQTHRGHLHFLASSGPGSELSQVSRQQLWSRLYENIGRSRIEPYDPARGARYYLGKEYLAKGGQVDYLGPTWKWQAALGVRESDQLSMI